MRTCRHRALCVLICFFALSVHSVLAATLTVPILEDTSVWQSNPASSYGTGQTLRVAGGGAGNDWNSLLKFNVSGVYGPVSSAKLRLHNLDVLAGTVSVFKTTSNWSETTVTWNNAPAAQQQLAQVTNPPAGQIVEWDVAAAIAADGLVSFRMTHTNPGQSQDFRSREFGTTPPQLVVTFATAPPTQNTNFAFTRDYTAGTLDANGQLRSGIELMRLTSYGGKLYAATSMFGDTYGTSPYPGYTGCQVLRKDSSSAAWQVDVSFGSKYLRTDCLEVIRFTHDEFGNALTAPGEMLVAGIWDVGTLPGGRGRFISVAIRNDTNGQWFISQVVPVPDSEAGFPSVRSMSVHRDSVSGAQYLFIGAANGGIFKGVYDATVAGRIRWVGTNEVDSTLGRPQSMAEANGSLYVSFDYGGITVTGQTGGVYRRTDGPVPSWQQVYRNYDASQPNQNQTFRGLTAVPSLSGPGEAVLGGIEVVPAPLITRIEPSVGDAAFTELNYWDYFTTVFGAAPLLDNNVGGAALNKCEPFLDPETGATQHFITSNLRHPNDPQTGYNGAYFLLRRSATHYEWCEVPSLGLPTGQQLRGIRTVEKSPFADEPRTYYFGGYSSGLAKVSNTAWIYKGVYRTPFEIQMAGLPSGASQKTFTADLDGDGLRNGIEFAFGLNANNPNDGTGVPQPTFNFITGTATMSVTTPPGLWGLRYGAQYSENLTSWTNLTDTGTGSTHLFTLSLLNRPRLFLRWVITSD
jgi:hypothetical protein